MIAKGLFWTGIVLFAILGVLFPSFLVPGDLAQVNQGDVLYTLILGVCLYGITAWVSRKTQKDREIELAKKLASENMYTCVTGGVLVEESVFRGLLPATLISLGFGGVTSFILAGISFIAMHFIGDSERFTIPCLLCLISLTIILTGLTILTGTVLPAIGVHLVNNIIATKLYSKEPTCQT